MQIGMTGLGRMGANRVLRLLAGRHECVVFDRSPKTVEEMARAGADAMARTGAVFPATPAPPAQSRTL